MATELADADRSRGREAALAARRIRARAKRDLRAGRITGSDVLWLAAKDSADGRALARMTIGDLLLSLPGVGRVTADRALVAANLNGRRRLAAMGPHQRAALAEYLQ